MTRYFKRIDADDDDEEKGSIYIQSIEGTVFLRVKVLLDNNLTLSGDKVDELIAALQAAKGESDG